MDDYKNDIDRYLKGELTPAQMHALEKKALNDPFLADALEGVQSLHAEELRADLDTLQAAIDKRALTGHASPWLWIGRIAAGLLLLAVSTYLIILISNRSDEKSTGNLALNKQKEQTPAPVEEDEALSVVEDSTSISNSDAVRSRASAPGEEKNEKSISREQPAASRSQATESLAEIHQEQTSADEEVKREVPRLEATEKNEEQIAPAAPEERQKPIAKKEAERKMDKLLDDDLSKSARGESVAGAPAKAPINSNTANRKVIRGKVTFSDDGTGLPGVNVLIKGSNEGTVTDDKGNYEIPVSEGQSTLLFSFIGFSNKEVETKTDEVNVQLDADVSELSEVVVVGYGSKDIDFLPSTPTVMELATPEGGRKVFKQYLEQNLRYPEQALKNKVEGKVTVQFTIGTSGQISDFKVVRGLGYGCDEEVIRLIKAGPKWYPTKKNEAPIQDRVRVRMRFALPKK